MANKDGSGKMLLKSDREKCWQARDAYFACLAAGDGKAGCSKELAAFHSSCPRQWIDHFVRKKEYDLFKEKMERGEVSDSDIKSHMTFSIPREARSKPA